MKYELCNFSLIERFPGKQLTVSGAFEKPSNGVYDVVGRNGDTYAGEYFADKMHGYGVYKFANGHRYEGSWHDGRKQGLGIYTFRNGDTHAGHWHLGTLEGRSTQVPNASAPVAVNHSKVLNAVQVMLCMSSCLGYVFPFS